MKRTNKITRPNKSTGEIYISRYPRKCKSVVTETYKVRFPKQYKIESKSFTGDGAFRKAINWRNSVARNHRIFIQDKNYKYNYSPPEHETGKKGVVDQCGPNFNGNFEYHVITDDGERIRKIVDKSQFDIPSWIKGIGAELGIPFTSEMFRQDHPGLIGKRVYVQSKWYEKIRETRISYCRPDRDAVRQSSGLPENSLSFPAIENDMKEEKENADVIEMIHCDKAKSVQFTFEQQAEIERIVAQRMEEALREMAERIAPCPVQIKQDDAL